ncbi:hypothetical protein LOTGIDRAFT_160729 [Lottia gigantea]|uniref:EF-hand domain-containing protein n=1 Tax=Lottia gigantea TaxID=225164 RepID=V4AJS8_LOTGI|nr:hypothetical protein LOTGIDRAFT_160729 [Lottia gigantea]ESO94975.1 hypothetical protein LOTGIDRAFT_160729 [Lottia gigantea]
MERSSTNKLFTNSKHKKNVNPTSRYQNYRQMKSLRWSQDILIDEANGESVSKPNKVNSTRRFSYTSNSSVSVLEQRPEHLKRRATCAVIESYHDPKERSTTREHLNAIHPSEAVTSRLACPNFNTKLPFSCLVGGRLGSSKISLKSTDSEESGIDSECSDEVKGSKRLTFPNIFINAYDAEADEEYSFEDSTDDEEEEFGFSPEYLYRNICSKSGQRPLRCVQEQLMSPTLSLNDRLLLREDVKAICILLSKTDTITTLDLSRNNLCNDGARSTAEMLKRNDGIVRLELKYCNLSPAGIGWIVESLERNKTVQIFDLTGNKLSTSNMKQLADLLKKNKTIYELILSYCDIDEAGAIILASAIAENVYLKSLDVSWNGIRKRGAVAFCDGLAQNTGLEYVNLSWNGLAKEGSKALGNCLMENRILKQLDLTCNRIDYTSLKPLANGLVQNETLKKIKLSLNPFTTKGAIGILCAIKKSPDCAINEIDLTEIPVNSEFMKCLAELHNDRPIQVLHGDHLHQTGTLKAESALDSYDPCMVLFEFMRQKKLRLTDLFRVIDTDNSGSITRQELIQAFQAMNLPLSEGSLHILMKRLDKDHSNEIDLSELKNGQKNALRKAQAMRSRSAEYAAILHDIQEHVKSAIDRKRRNKPYKEQDIISQIERVMK